MTHGKLNGYLEVLLSPAMTIYYKYGLDKKEEKQCFLLQIWEGVWESLSAKEWVTQYL